MHLFKIITFVSFLCLFATCSHNSKNDNTLEADAADTLVNSIPFNYMDTVEAAKEDQRISLNSYKAVLDIFEGLNYTYDSWQAGIREVPRVYLITVADRWGNSGSKEITTKEKKRIFFRGLAPMVLHANELIMKDRNRLDKIRSTIHKGDSIYAVDQVWLNNLAKTYKVKNADEETMISIADELWNRVDIVPPSLALSQSATESGWGTSRFVSDGNALYGQWAWGEKAMKPDLQREHLGDYGIAAFESIQESVSAYMLNLNTHNAYADLRKKRAELRKKGEEVTGVILAEQLTRYSEKGDEYVKSLLSMMEHNRLGPTDDAYLSNNAPIYLIPEKD